MYKVETTGSKADIYTPYNADFVARIKNVNGRWNSGSKCWTVDASAVDAVREIMRDVYGRDDMEAGETVRVRLTFAAEVFETDAPVAILGHTIALASGQDARPGEGVLYIKGRPAASRSKKYLRNIVEAGSVVELVSVPKRLVDTAALPYGVTLEVVQSKTIDREALLAERKRLEARLAEIAEMLAE